MLTKLEKDRIEKETMVKHIEQRLNEVEEMWKSGSHSHAHIVGYLEGTLKGIKYYLEADLEK